MPEIIFDVLIPAQPAEQLSEKFDWAITRLVGAKKITGGTVTVDHQPTLLEGVEDNLRQNYRDEHEEAELEDATVVRYVLAIEGLQGSVNSLTMALSRFLTPQADLPADPVLLENEVSHEVAAIYPWAVEIRR